MSSILNRVANYQNALSTKRNHFRSIIGIVQYSASEDVEANFKKAEMYIKECSEKGAMMVCLPEHFAYMSQANYVQGGDMTKGFPYRIGDGKGGLFDRYRQLALDH